MNKRKYKQGQVLLIVVLLLAAALTMVMTISFTSRTETQVTKLQQDADKSLVAAEAGIEAAIKTQSGGSFSDLSLNALQDSGIDINNSNVTVDSTQTKKFVSPTINKDEQYTLYLTQFNNGTFGQVPFDSSTTVYYGNGVPCSSLALELTVISFDGTIVNPAYTVERYVADTGSPKILGTDGAQIGNDISKFGGRTVLTTNFNCATSPIALRNTLPNTAKLMFIRVIGVGATSKIGIDQGTLPVQGKYYTATAKSTSGVTKKVQLFQSYPQLPAEFYVTSF